MLYYNLGPIFKARGIQKPYSFLVKAGISPQTAYRVIHSEPRVLRLDHVEKLCHLLVCEPNDLLAWSPDSNKTYTPDHPLYALQKKETPASLSETIKNLPLKKLRELEKQIGENKEE